MKYILVGQSVVEEPDLMKWGVWFEEADRRVAVTEIGGYYVSTVFLGLDHNFIFSGPPILFETMVFCDGQSIDRKRCSTWLEAEAQHARVCEEYRAKWEQVGAAARPRGRRDTSR